MNSFVIASLSVALTVGLVGCGSTTTNRAVTSPTTTSTDVGSSTVAAAPAPPATVTSLPGEDLDGTVRALGTAFVPCKTGREFAAPKVLDLATGKFITPPAPTEVPAGAELLYSTCTLTGTPEDPKVLYLWQYKTPAAGLTPASVTVMGAITGVHDTAPVTGVDLSGQAPVMGDGAQLLPTSGGAVLRVGYGCQICTVAFDPSTPKITWTHEKEYATHDDSSVAFKIDKNVVIRDVGTGQDTVLEVFGLAGQLPKYHHLDSGYLLWEQGGLGDWTFGYYSTVAHRRFENVFIGSTPNVTAGDGRILLHTQKLLRLLNITTGEVEFELGPQELQTLDSYQFAYFGNYLYVRNNNDSPVLDMTTKQRVSSGWKVRPVGWLNPSWLIVDHRNTGVGQCYQSFGPYDCASTFVSDGDFALTKVDGGNYPGPMF